MVERFCARSAFLVSVLGGLAACAGDAVAPAEPARDAANLYWDLTLNHNAINLSTAAPYDTFRLVATPRRQDGTPIEGLPAPTFVSADPRRVLVSPDGLVRALRSANRLRIIATVADTAGNLVHADTALVNVTTNSTPPMIARLSLEPSPTDSAKSAMPQPFLFFLFYYPQPQVVVRGFDAQENPIATTNLAVWIESSDPLTARYDNTFQRLSFLRPGPVRFIARTAVYGVELADTLDYAIGLPLATGVNVQTQSRLDGTRTYRFNPATVTVGTGAYVWWFHPAGVPLYDVTFDDPTHVAADQVHSADLACGADNLVGNITQFGDTTTNGRQNACTRYFPVPGTYTYHSQALNASGTIVVVDESQAPAAARLGFGSH